MRPRTTNLQCVNSDTVGRYCLALNEIHKNCLKGGCPFYKTDYQFKTGEAKAKRHCDDLGIVFRTRAEVMDDMNKVSQIQKTRYQKEKKTQSLKVIQYNSKENTYVEYDSIESVAKELGVSTEKVERLIKYKEPYKGYRFVFA